MIRVLESVSAPGSTVKFIDQVVRYAPDDVAFSYFSWRAALRGDYDVFHVHWPEFLWRSRQPLVAAARMLLTRLFLRRLRRRGIPIVRTFHNPHPHRRATPREERLLARIDRQTALWVLLTPCTPPPTDAPQVVIPHGDYREQFGTLPAASVVAGRVLHLGRIEPYKNVPALVDAFAAAARPGEELRVVGRPSDELRRELTDRAASWDVPGAAFSVQLEHVADEQMVAEMSAAEVVVLPYREMANSGVLLVALSLGTPVVVPDSCTNAHIADEVGPGWIHRYRGELTPDILRTAIDDLRGQERDSPRLEARDWHRVARAYRDAFARVATPGGGDATD